MLTPAQDSQVQYAMSFDTINGTGTAAAMSDGRPIIAKTGTTDDAQSAFFIGAIPQYALTVGIFTDSQSDNSTETLNNLGGNVGGGFGGYWPARIWNTFAENEFASAAHPGFPDAAVQRVDMEHVRRRACFRRRRPAPPRPPSRRPSQRLR